MCSRSWTAPVAILVLLAVVACRADGAAGVPIAAPGPRVEVAPAEAAPGEAIELRGSGWPAGAALGARLYEAGNANGPGADLGMAFMADAEGRFQVVGTVPPTLFGPGGRANLAVVPGAYVVVVRHGTELSATASLTVGAPQQGALLWGEAYFDLDGNGRRDANDVAAAGVLVSIEDAGSTRPAAQAITDARGRYLLTPVTAGLYRVRVEAMFRSATWAGAGEVRVEERRAVRLDVPLR